ncbi:MAG: hypothetical protein K940chlam2_01150 [Chlamydiae bacterium]|nr:hypothetical protein [Chlamydiota bacterium]
MSIPIKIFLWCLVGLTSAYGAENSGLTRLSRHARSCVELLPSAPEVYEMIDVLEKEGVYQRRGGDDLRVKFVTLQGVVEYVLTCASALGEIHKLEGMIHTPAPATPLCAPIQEVDMALLDRSIRQDLKKLLTVQSRAHTVRQYLHQGSRLTITYPESGLVLRSPEQRAQHQELLASFPENLVDRPLKVKALDDQMIGATYLFQNRQGKTFAFSIMSKQAIDPRNDSEWGIWLGPIDHPAVKARVDAVVHYFDSIGGPQFKDV